MSISYKDAGVDVHRGYEAVDKMKTHVKSTFNKRVLGDFGSFGGFFDIANMCENPVLVSGTDGVGTKLKYAFILDTHNTIGIDAVAMCVNDVICSGAKPLFFLDYFATGKIDPNQVAAVVSGCAEGCRQSDAALIGGETAEMPGFYSGGEYDIAGFSVGIVDRNKVIDGKKITENDTLIGLASSGVHSNGFSLVRKLFSEDKQKLLKVEPSLGHSLADEVLIPTRIYVKNVLQIIQKYSIKGIAHITGGGFIENIPRMFPQGIGAKVDLNSYPVLPVFNLLKKLSGLDNDKLYNTFNMGIGMVMCVDKNNAENVVKFANDLGEKAYIIGHTIKGEGITF